jgi:hypothetical protein
MPLRDPFHPPLYPRRHWQSFHAGWASTIAQRLNSTHLPPRFYAEPEVHFRPESPIMLRGSASVLVHKESAASTANTVVASVEWISEANKDRSGSRELFLLKCPNYLRSGVCVALVDVVTNRRSNLLHALLERLAPETVQPELPPLYAATLRAETPERQPRVESWFEPLALGEVLPSLPLWLTRELAVPLELEHTYEQTRENLRIP